MDRVDSWLETTNFTSDDVQLALSYLSRWEQDTPDADSDLGMDFSDDGLSPTSENTSQPVSFLGHMPKLVPKAPSSKRGSRTPSPTRKILTLLERARPPIQYRQPGNAVVQPDQVINLRRSIIKDKGLQVIPRALEVSIFATHRPSS